MHELYVHTTPFYVKDFSIHGILVSAGIPEPFPMYTKEHLC